MTRKSRKKKRKKTWYTIEMYGHNDGPMGTVDSMTQNLSQIMQKRWCVKKKIVNNAKKRSKNILIVIWQ